MSTMTSVTEDTRCRARPQLRDATSLDSKDRTEQQDGPAAVRHTHFHTADPVAAQRFFTNAYHPGWRITEFARGATVTHRRYAAEHLTVDDVTIQGRVDCEIRTSDRFVVIQPRSGSLIAVGNGSADTDTPMLAVDGFPRLLRLNSVRFTVVSIDADLLQQVGAGSHTPMPQQVEFLSSRPRTPVAARMWRTHSTTSPPASPPPTRHGTRCWSPRPPGCWPPRYSSAFRPTSPRERPRPTTHRSPRPYKPRCRSFIATPR
ncbi:araC family transcriptional regulator [Mycobacterium kansasii]|uniref:AraC family transcriptional regulator n=1 Tax=Mycobacterium kansasii TaxID=1768 RepID=A0A1V3X1Q0_MYCKA|nr:araC family transcriptional regulator [Mycobacterium kansasii]